MKAVILVAGRGTRMGDLTKDTPKPMLMIGEKNLIEYKIDVLPEAVDEVILIIGYLGHIIREYFGDAYEGRKITYVEVEPFGTAYALWQARHLLTERFLLLNGDDLYTRKDIAECMKYDQAALVFELHRPMAGGKMILKDGFVEDILEGAHSDGGLISTGFFIFSPHIFDYPLQKMPGREEWGIPPTIVPMLPEFGIHAVSATAWKQISAKEDLQMSPEQVLVFSA